MLSTFFTVALFVAASIHGVFAGFAINSPQLVQCQSAKVSWEPTQGPYNVVVTKATDPCGDPLVDLGDFQTTLTHWKVNVPAGTEVLLSVIDARDQEAWSKKITIGPSSDSSCLPGNTPPSSPTPSPTPSGNLTPIGAANSVDNPFKSSAITARQASGSVIALAGLVIVVTLFY